MKSILSLQNGMELHDVHNVYQALEESSIQLGGALRLRHAMWFTQRISIGSIWTKF